CWQPVAKELKFAVIPNTLEVTDLWVSAALAAEARAHPHLELVGEPTLLPFDAAGNLVQELLFPHSVRGRRNRAEGGACAPRAVQQLRGLTPPARREPATPSSPPVAGPACGSG